MVNSSLYNKMLPRLLMDVPSCIEQWWQYTLNMENMDVDAFVLGKA